ncbi:MAG: hypothetical protein Q4Q37_05760 [Methanobrevibacter sp.]|nr:hypothetical protein [Methanobrevibacter sp.]
MKNKINRKSKKYKIAREKLKELLNDESQVETVQNMIKNNEIPFDMFHEVSRELRMEQLFEDLNVDWKDLMNAKKKVIKLGPKSEYPLFSTLYRDHDGQYKVETLINEYHDSTLREGMMVGISYGEKFIVEDIQNNRFTKEDILNMGMDEIIEYCDEERDEI